MKAQLKLSFGRTLKAYAGNKIVQILTAIFLMSGISLLYFNYINSFAFVDEFNNIVMRYFLDRGRHLYTTLFFNHQFLIVYLSLALQHLGHVETLIRAIGIHRIFMIGFSGLMTIALVVRFGLPALGLIPVYEFFKYYSFGFTFQAESIIVYPMIYLFSLVWISLKEKAKVYSFDYILAAASAWFCIYMREPYIPLALFLFGLLVFIHRRKKLAIVSAILFLAAAVGTLFFLPLEEYIHQVFILNSQGVAATELGKESNFVTAVISRYFYPFLMYFGWKVTYFRFVLGALCGVLIYSSYIFIAKFKQYKEVLFVWTTLFLAAVRFVPPGTELYGGYRLAIWFGILTMAVMFFLTDRLFIKKEPLRLKYTAGIFFTIIFILMFSPFSFFWNKVDRANEFYVNYTPYFMKGELVKDLASPGDTFYIDGFDSLMYWQSGLDSPFKYALFYPVMLTDKKFVDERNTLLAKYKPPFFYSECITTYPGWTKLKKSYVMLRENKGKSCFFISKEKLKSLPKEKLDSVKKYGFTF